MVPLRQFTSQRGEDNVKGWQMTFLQWYNNCSSTCSFTPSRSGAAFKLLMTFAMTVTAHFFFFFCTSLSGPLCQFCLFLGGKKQTEARTTFTKASSKSLCFTSPLDCVCVSARKVRHSCAEELQKSLFRTRSPSDQILTRDINPVDALRETTFCLNKTQIKLNHFTC